MSREIVIQGVNCSIIISEDRENMEYDKSVLKVKFNRHNIATVFY